MRISSDKTQDIRFAGATRKLSRTHFETAREIIDVFEKHPKSDGIAGSLPHSWIKNIIPLSKGERADKIKTLYKLFRESFKIGAGDNTTQISKKFTKVLKQLNVIPEENQIIVKNRAKLKGAFLRGAFVIQERGKNKTLEPLFVKQFVDNTRRRSANDSGIFAELAMGLHLDRLIHDERILKPYFGDTKGMFMVSKYEVAPQNVKLPRKLSRSESFDDLCLAKYIKKLYKITNDKTNVQELLMNKGFFHCDLHDENLLITRNKKGKLIVKLIDLGEIEKYLTTISS